MDVGMTLGGVDVGDCGGRGGFSAGIQAAINRARSGSSEARRVRLCLRAAGASEKSRIRG